MTYQESNAPFDFRKQVIWWIAIIIGMMLMLCSCTTTRTVTVPVVHTDTLRLTHVQRDSIYLHDSINTTTFMRGDTTYLLKDRWHTQYRDRLVHDTAYISRRDSVPVPYPVEKRVPAQLSWHQQARIYLADLVLIALGLCALMWMWKRRSMIKRLFK